MANRKKEVYKPKPMTEGKRNLIQGLLQEYDIQSAEDIQEQIRLSEEKIRKLKQDQKILARKHAEQLRKERTHRLCTIGGMLEGFLKVPESFTEDEVYELLKLAFNQPPVDSVVRNHIRQKSAWEERPDNQEELTD